MLNRTVIIFTLLSYGLLRGMEPPPRPSGPLKRSGGEYDGGEKKQKQKANLVLPQLPPNMSAANKSFLSAAACGDAEGIAAARAAGADLNVRDLLGLGALYYALRNVHPNVFSLLRRFHIDQGSDFPRWSSAASHCFAPGEREINITLFVAAVVSYSARPIIASLRRGAAVNSIDIHHRTPLFFAVAYNRIATVQALLAHGADVNLADDTGVTPVILAARFGFVDIMGQLLRNGGNLEAHGSDGTLLHSAAERKHFSMIRYLLRRGAIYTQADHDTVARACHDFPLAFAAIRGDVNEIHDIIGQETNSSKIIDALIVAIAQGQENAVAALISFLISSGNRGLLCQRNVELQNDPLGHAHAFLAQNNCTPERRGAYERIYAQLLGAVGSLMP